VYVPRKHTWVSTRKYVRTVRVWGFTASDVRAVRYIACTKGVLFAKLGLSWWGSSESAGLVFALV